MKFRIENRSARIHCSLQPGQAKEYSAEEMVKIAAAVAGAMQPVAQRLDNSKDVNGDGISVPGMKPQRQMIHVFAVEADGEQELSAKELLSLFQDKIDAAQAARVAAKKSRDEARVRMFTR